MIGKPTYTQVRTRTCYAATVPHHAALHYLTCVMRVAWRTKEFYPNTPARCTHAHLPGVCSERNTHSHLLKRPPEILVLQIMQRLRGDLPLPWEGDVSLEVHRRLGSFRSRILQLLHREPALRMTMRSFHHACNRLFDARTTIEA